MTTAQYWKAKAKLAGFRSGEELWFKYWLDELEQAKLVYDVQYEPEKLVLSEKIIYETFSDMNMIKQVSIPNSGHTYRPDFVFRTASEKVIDMFHAPDYNGIGYKVYTDIKGNFSRFADSECFPIKQTWIYQRYNIWVNKVIPDELFKKTFVPDKLRCSPKTGKPLPKYKTCKTLNQWLCD